MEFNIVEAMVNAGGTLGLACFAIWMLQRVWQRWNDEMQERLAEGQEERGRLAAMVDRNTEAWVSATSTMAAICEAAQRNAHDLSSIRLLLSRRRCIGTDALLGEDEHGGH